ncbi:uncharacterized protein PFL1_04020 [Pseudozyma flocculosa PF-1]|uniref:Uncharacterized protein n=2 Tax=Pseudozyma flocculosa TaxID=84751 RepID=A0A5C3EV26_9BASI|nr:uncharacterized protein PFL1_04020 [Pseudozyma flocculosa PF-1]EPQ28192.1 hypothetical protein PFL1_04020 [Pseudozyma flocculosa PF-1]SPO35327.1 uncharacterized protein PSFLO_00798 [Pseudozyma flocculosa]
MSTPTPAQHPISSQQRPANDDMATSQWPRLIPATTQRPPHLPRHHLNGTQDVFRLFDLVPIYDRAVRPFLQQQQQQQQQQQPAATPLASHAAPTPSSSTPLPFPLAPHLDTSLTPTTTATAATTTAANATTAAPAGSTTAAINKRAKPPATYAHYLSDIAGRVKPPSKRNRAAKPDKPSTSLVAILNKPEYTPQRILPFDAETLRSAFVVQSGPVDEIDQSLLEPDEEDAAPRKKKKKRDKAAAPASAAGTAPPSTAAAATPRPR